MFIFEFVGTVAFAVVGALIGIQKKLDIFGVIILAVTTAVGGGMFRDMLIGNLPPLILRNSGYLMLSIIVALLVCLCHNKIRKFNTVINIFDAIGLGAFAASGSSMALQYEGNTLVLMILLAVITAAGGGAIRDIMIKEIPFILCKEIYAVAVIFGAVAFYFAYPYFAQPIPLYLCFIVTTAVRLVSMKYNINLPVIKQGMTN